MALGTALAIGGIASNLLGGLFGKKTAKSAAQIQAQAATDAGQNIRSITDQSNAHVTNAAYDAGNAVHDTAENAAGASEQATGNANALLNPYAQAGSTAADVLNRGVAEGGDFNRMPTAADIQIDPGYAFREQQAELAFQRSAAAHGGVDNGGYLRDLNTFSQGNASQEFQNAYDRFQNSTKNRFNNVFSVAGQGKDAAGQQGTNLIRSAEYGGNARLDARQYQGNTNVNAANLTSGRTIQAQDRANEYNLQGANAVAGGQVAGNNALWNGVNGAVNAATDAYQSNMFNSVPQTSNGPGTEMYDPNAARKRRWF